jgi:hypothetical protein
MAASLESVLAKRRLHGGERNIVLVHGSAARDALWLHAFVAQKVRGGE